MHSVSALKKEKKEKTNCREVKLFPILKITLTRKSFKGFSKNTREKKTILTRNSLLVVNEIFSSKIIIVFKSSAWCHFV